MGVRMSTPVGDRHRQVLDLIRAAGAKGITERELAERMGYVSGKAASALCPLDPVYEEYEPSKGFGRRGNEVRYFWCGKEESNG